MELRGRKTWADRQHLPTGVMGEVHRGITISEKNRATVYEYRREGIEELMKYAHENYRRKGINFVIFGVHAGEKTIKYAVFVQSGFLKEVSEDDET